MEFTVVNEFQVGGINFEEGNTHKKHNLTDGTVMSFYHAGFVDVEGVSVPRLGLGVSAVQPDDMTIEIVGD